MINQIAYYLIFGKPLIMYFGILTYSSFLFTAYIAIMNKRRKTKIPFIWHKRMAIISISMATIHALMGILSYF